MFCRIKTYTKKENVCCKSYVKRHISLSIEKNEAYAKIVKKSEKIDECYFPCGFYI